MSVPEDDFAAMFEASLQAKRLDKGEIVEGRIVSIGPEVALVDVGGKGEAVIAIDELKNADGEIEVVGIRALDEAGPADLTFVTDAKRVGQLPASRAGAVILPESVPAVDRPALRTSNPYLALAREVVDRYQHAADLQDALAQYLFSRGLKVTSRDIAHLVQDCLREKERSAPAKPKTSNIIDAKAIISHRLPLEAAADAYHMFAQKKDECRMFVLSVSAWRTVWPGLRRSCS